MTGGAWLAVAIVSCALGGLCLWRLYRRVLPALTRLDQNFRVPDMRGHYTADALFTCFDGVGAEGRLLLNAYWRTDYGFMLCFLAAMAAITMQNVPWAWLRAAMLAAACLRALADAVENALLLRVCAAYPARRMARAAGVCGWVTTAKFALLGLWLVGLFASLAVRGMGM